MERECLADPEPAIDEDPDKDAVVLVVEVAGQVFHLGYGQDRPADTLECAGVGPILGRPR